MYFDGSSFYYTVFDHGIYHDNIKVPFCSQHLIDLQDLREKMQKYDSIPVDEKRIWIMNWGQQFLDELEDESEDEND